MTAGACSLLAQDCTTVSNACLWGGAGDPSCVATPGNISTGGTCTDQSCVIGDVCARRPTDTVSTCRVYCNLDGGTPGCPSGTCTDRGIPQGAGVCE
jgi:hypothetical protein